MSKQPIAKTKYGFTILVAIASIYLLFVGISDVITGEKTRGWQSTQAQVKDSMIGCTATSRYSHHETLSDITYVYTVSGVKYTGTRISYVGAWPRPWYTAPLYPNDQICIYYNPENPAQSVLNYGQTFEAWLCILGAIIGFMSAVQVFYFQPEWSHNDDYEIPLACLDELRIAGLAVETVPSDPGSVYVYKPATANSVAKLAKGTSKIPKEGPGISFYCKGNAFHVAAEHISGYPKLDQACDSCEDAVNCIRSYYNV